MNDDQPQHHALLDLDGTVADLSGGLREKMGPLAHPDEPAYQDRYDDDGGEPPWIEARRKLVQRVPGFWRGLARIELGFDVVRVLRETGFSIHVLTKGPQSNSIAWSEKLDWVRQHLPGATVTVTGDKSIAYGRVLVDDWPEYFLPWLARRPRGLVVCVAQPWNALFAKGSQLEHPNVFRYDGRNGAELTRRIQAAHDRKTES